MNNVLRTELQNLIHSLEKEVAVATDERVKTCLAHETAGERWVKASQSLCAAKHLLDTLGMSEK